MVSLLLPVIYLAFISLGLPDSLLGSAWPVMYQELGTSVSAAGIISMIVALGTIVSSLQSDRLTRRLGTGKVTAVSVAMTAVALWGFSVSNAFWQLCLWAVPYGLGAGSVDASLNNYVALHYKSKHMSWLHCMWGVGAASGPYIMGYVMTSGGTWNAGYRTISVIQLVLTVVLIFSLPLWKKRPKVVDTSGNETEAKPLSLKEILRIPGVKEVLACFFCYCAVEQTAGLWASSYLTLHKGVLPETAASFASMFFIGITAGRAISGFVTMKLNDTQMVRLGQGLIGCGVIILFLPLGATASLVGFVVIGLGCAPIYPSIVALTPGRFGERASQGLVSLQMACAYTGAMVVPPLFGMVAGSSHPELIPFMIAGLLAADVVLAEVAVRRCAESGRQTTDKRENQS